MLNKSMMNLCLIVLILLVTAKSAHAYIDPNTGGYVFQILFPILSGIATIFLFFRNQAKKVINSVVSFIRRAFMGKKDD